MKNGLEEGFTSPNMRKANSVLRSCLDKRHYMDYMDYLDKSSRVLFILNNKQQHVAKRFYNAVIKTQKRHRNGPKVGYVTSNEG